jgi:hypothetical protein
MARLAWIASEVGSATGFPHGDIIAQKPRRDEGHTQRRCSCLTAKCLPNWITSGSLSATPTLG